MSPDNSANQPSHSPTPPRSIKSLGINPTQKTDFLSVFNFFNEVVAANFKRKTNPFDTSLSTTDNIAINTLRPNLISHSQDNQKYLENSIQYAQQQATENPNFLNSCLLPADVVTFLYDLAVAFRKFYQEQLLDAQESALKDAAARLQQHLLDIQNGYLSQWPNNQIAADIEIQLAKDLFNKSSVVKRLISDLILTMVEVMELIGEISPEEAGLLKQEQEPANKPETTTAKVVSASDAEDDSGDTEQTEQEDTTAQPSQEPIVEPYSETDRQLTLFSSSFSVLVVNSLLAAYSVPGQESLFRLDNLDPETKRLLLSQFAPIIKKIILSLSAEDIRQLLENGPQSAMVRLKILRQAHQFAIYNPMLRFLLQQAVNDHFAQLESDDQDQTPLRRTIATMTHRQAAENLETIANNIELDEEQLTSLKKAYTFPFLSADSFNQQFSEQISRILGDSADQSRIAKSIVSLNSTLTNLLLDRPSLGSTLITSLSNERLSTLCEELGFTPETFRQNEIQLRELFNQYWNHYYNKISQLYPNLDPQAQYTKALTLSNLTAQHYKQQFSEQIAQILGTNADPAKISQAISSLDTSLTSLTIANPLLNESFIDSLSYGKLFTLCGEIGFTVQSFQVNEDQIRSLFKQYWFHYRNELNELYPELDQLSKMAPEEIKLNEEEVDNVLGWETDIRNKLVANDPTNNKADQPQVAGKLALNAFAGRTEEPSESADPEDIRKKYQEYADTFIGELKTKIWQSKTEQEIAIYNQLVQQEQQVSQQQALNYFAMVRATYLHQQAIMLAQAQVNQEIEAQIISERARSEHQSRIYAQNLVIFQNDKFFAPNEELYSEPNSEQAQPQEPGQPQSPGTASQLGSQIKGAANKYLAPTAEIATKAATEVIDKGLIAATGGALAALPAPIRKALIEKGVKKTAKILPYVIGGGIAGVGAILGALKQAGASLVPVGVGTGAGFLIGGPVGAGIGFLGGTIFSGARLLGQKIGAKIFIDTPSMGKAISDLGSTVTTQAGFGGKAVSGFQSASPLAGVSQAAAKSASATGLTPAAGSTAAGSAAAGSTAATSLTTTLASAGAALGPAGIIVGSSVFITSLIGILSMTQILSAFLINVDYDHLKQAGISMFADVNKTVRVINEDSNCLGKSSCPEPHFPIEVEYSITITPKNGSTVVINNIADTQSHIYNKKAYQEEGRSAPTNRTTTKSAEELGLTDLIGREITEPITVTYKQTYTQDNNHSLIRNVVLVEFNYSTTEENSTDSAKSSTSFSIGKPPTGILCWPVAGIITYAPYSTIGNIDTHRDADAYDIAPTNDWKIYAPTSGTLCAGKYGSAGSLYDDGYGYVVTLSTKIGDDDYKFRFAHLRKNTAIVNSNECKEVNQGDMLGIVGNTGNSKGSHLHFERVRANNNMTLTELMTGGTGSTTLPIGTYVNSCTSL